MADANELVRIFKRAARDEREASKPVNVFFGKVRSVKPLKIEVEQKMVLGQAQLVLARNVTDYTADVTVQWDTEEHEARHKHTGGGGDTGYADVPHSHRVEGKKSILVHNGLQKGDEVILIRQQEGQKFVVIDRIGGRI